MLCVNVVRMNPCRSIRRIYCNRYKFFLINITKLTRLRYAITEFNIVKEVGIDNIGLIMTSTKYNKLKDLRSIVLDLQIDTILQASKMVQPLLEEYMSFTGSFTDRVKNYFYNDSVICLKQMKAELKIKYDCESINYETDDKNVIDALIIKGRRNNNNKNKVNNSNNINNTGNLDNIENSREDNPLNKQNNLMIICNQNGSPLEFFSQNDRLIEFYLDYNANVLVWNYRGYGFSTGTCSFQVNFYILIIEYTI